MQIIEDIKNEISKVVVAQEQMVDALLMGLLCDGHVLVEGIPGLAKTTTIKTLAKVLELDFKRVQFTPDLLPSDILGSEVYNPKDGDFRIKKGAIFTNLLLADEINRAPAKVQSALLEVMAESQVTLGDESYRLDAPFLVLATQNPLENEGVYPLPEAQLDRFMLKVKVGYNSSDEELLIARRAVIDGFTEPKSVASVADLAMLKEHIKRVHIDEPVQRYMIDIVAATRDPSIVSKDKLSKYIEFGASPRVSIDMFRASRAKALLEGRDFVKPSDIIDISLMLMRHRIVLSYDAVVEDVDVDDILSELIEAVAIP